MRLFLSLLPLALLLAGSACASASSTNPSGQEGDAATRPDALMPGDGAPGSAACRVTGGGGLACDPRTEMCVNDYAHVSGLGTDSCQPLPAACVSNPTCACVTAAFRCGITTSCVEGTVPLQLVCQPD